MPKPVVAVVKLTAAQIADLVDKIGAAKAVLAPGLEDLDAMIEQLKAQGAAVYSGDLFDANVFDSERTKYNMDAIREKLTPQFLRAHSKQFNVRTCKVTAKKTAGKRVAVAA
jgi:hypothetical protein